MDASLFDYHLPNECIAQEPAATRDASRLMVVDRAKRTVTHSHFAEIAQFLPDNSRFFRNNAAVLKARIFGQRPTGGKVECLLLQPAEDAVTWWCLLRPGKKAAQTGFGLEGEYHAEVLEAGNNGNYRVRFHLERNESVTDLSERLGIMPLPPYIARDDNDPRREADNVRYQTVYARDPGAVAAPTAGLHFDDAMLAETQAMGVRHAFVTLHVGAGTFQALRHEDVEANRLHSERLVVDQACCDAVRQTREQGGRVIAVGTTSVRSLETAARAGELEPYAGETDLFIKPGYEFRIIDAMITNFHLPQSSLLMLVAASTADAQSYEEHDYILNCSGCHRMDGTGSNVVPSFQNMHELANKPGAREYWIRVPGAAQAPLFQRHCLRVRI